MASTAIDQGVANSEQVQALKQELEALKKEFEQRLGAMEAKLGEAKAAAPAPREEITPETLAMISAAVTAFLGKKVRIRSARVVSNAYQWHHYGSQWTHQGRVTVQASHNLR